MIKTTETLIFKESFEMCPYLRELQRESRRNAEIRDKDKCTDEEIMTDIPEATRLKAHLKRRTEQKTKNKWVQYATEYASEIIFSEPRQKDEIRRYMEMTREAVKSMNRKDKEKRAFQKERKRKSHEKHAFQ